MVRDDLTFMAYCVSPPGQPLQYGLVAEEAARVLPNPVQLDEEGQPLSVSYHALPLLLLNELQRQERALAAQEAELARLRAVLQELVELRKHGP